MKVSRLSATSLAVAMVCPARYQAEYVDYGKGITGGAAYFGSTIHTTLELFVRGVYVEHKFEDKLQVLLDIWKMQHALAYGGLIEDLTELRLGIEILTRWYERGDLRQPGRSVVSLEEKKTFTVRTEVTTGVFVESTIVYIRDRLDCMPDGSMTVVDYKTSAWGVTSDELRSKIQPLLYSLATQIEYPDAPGIWVEFDMLKHENQPVGTYFTKDDNRKIMAALRGEIRKIALIDEKKPPHILNDECLFCVKKAKCPAANKNANVGGIMSMTEDELIEKRAELEFQGKAVEAAKKELDSVLLPIARQREALELQSASGRKLVVGISRRRDADAERVQKIIGDTLWKKYGEGKISIATLDNLLKGSELTPEQKNDLRAAIGFKYGDPTLKVGKTSPFTI